MTPLIDTHCHIQAIAADAGEPNTTALWAKAKDISRDNVVERAEAAGVTKLICVGCSVNDSAQAVKFAARKKHCYAAAGVHPHEAKNFASPNEQSRLSELAKESKVVAIGECGLDYYYGHSPKEEQIKAFKYQLELAQEANLPIIFHVRNAFDDFWEVISDYSIPVGVIHSFSDTSANLQKALALGLYIGVNGIATFTKDERQLEAYKSIPLDKLVLETDAPYLTPVPHRGSVNEPKFTRVIAQFLAQLRREDENLLAAATTANAQKLFGI